MLNLGVLALSASSLERRITTMQRVSRTTPQFAGFIGLSAGVLLVLACSTNKPATPSAQPVASLEASREAAREMPNPEDLRINSDTMI